MITNDDNSSVVVQFICVAANDRPTYDYFVRIKKNLVKMKILIILSDSTKPSTETYPCIK